MEPIQPPSTLDEPSTPTGEAVPAEPTITVVAAEIPVTADLRSDRPTFIVLDARTLLADTDPVTFLTKMLADAHIQYAAGVAHVPGIFPEA